MDDNSNSDEKAWERAWSYDEMKAEALSKWTLAGDSGLHNFLECFSQQIVTRFHDTSKHLNEFHDDVTTSAVRLDNVFNSFVMLSNTQFVENRVYEEDITVSATTDTPVETKQKSRDEIEADLIPKVKDIVRKGLQVVADSYTVAPTDGLVVHAELVPTTKFKAKPLPCLIGSKEFFDTDAWKMVAPDEVAIVEESDTKDVPVDKDATTLEEIEDEQTPDIEPESDVIPHKKLKPEPVQGDLFSVPTADESGGLFDESEDEDELMFVENEPPADDVPSEPLEEDATTPAADPLMDALKSRLHPGSAGSKHSQDGSQRSSLSSSGMWAEVPVLPPKEDEPASIAQPSGGLFDDDDDDDDLFAIASRTPERKSTRGLSLADDSQHNEVTDEPSSRRDVPSKPKAAAVVSLFDDDESDDDLLPGFAPPPMTPSTSRDSKQPSRPTAKYASDLFDESSSEDDLFITKTESSKDKPKPVVPDKIPTTAEKQEKPAQKVPTVVPKMASKGLFDSSSDEDDIFAQRKTPNPPAKSKPKPASAKPVKPPSAVATAVPNLFGSSDEEDIQKAEKKSEQKVTPERKASPTTTLPSAPNLFGSSDDNDKGSKAVDNQTVTKSTNQSVPKSLFDDSSSDEDMFTSKTKSDIGSSKQGLSKPEKPDITQTNDSEPVTKPVAQAVSKPPVGGVSMFGAGGQPLVDALRERSKSVTKDVASDNADVSTAKPKPPSAQAGLASDSPDISDAKPNIPVKKPPVLLPTQSDQTDDDLPPPSYDFGGITSTAILPSVSKQKARIGPKRRKPNRLPSASGVSTSDATFIPDNKSFQDERRTEVPTEPADKVHPELSGTISGNERTRKPVEPERPAVKKPPVGAVPMFGGGSSITDAIKTRTLSQVKKTVGARLPSPKPDQNSASNRLISSVKSEPEEILENGAISPLPASVKSDSEQKAKADLKEPPVSSSKANNEVIHKPKPSSPDDEDDDLGIFDRVPPPMQSNTVKKANPDNIFDDDLEDIDDIFVAPKPKDDIGDIFDVPKVKAVEPNFDRLDDGMDSIFASVPPPVTSKPKKPSKPVNQDDVDDIFNDIDIFATKKPTKKKVRRKKRDNTSSKTLPKQPDIFDDPLNAFDNS